MPSIQTDRQEEWVRDWVIIDEHGWTKKVKEGTYEEDGGFKVVLGFSDETEGEGMGKEGRGNWAGVY